MLWVGGSIILHGTQVLGLPFLYDQIHHVAVAVSSRVGEAAGFVEWSVTAFLDGIFGIVLGMLLIPVVTRVLAPIAAAVSRKKKAAHQAGQ
jgi:predicted DNA repair protein MutK